jgi:hypothetical protein
MELIDCREVSRCQFFQVFAGAPQALRNDIGQLEIFAVMARYSVSHRLSL